MSRTRNTADLVSQGAIDVDSGKVGIGTTAKDGYSLYVQGNAEYVGVVTATSFVGPLTGGGANITGISTTNITNYGIGITFTQTGTGATTRTVDSKLKDIVSVKDFGAVGDNATDDTSAIQAAILSNPGGTIYFPKGNYLVSSQLEIRASGTKLVGESRDGSKIIGTNTANTIIDFGAGHSFVGLESLNIRYSSLAPASTIAVHVRSGYTTLNDFVISNAGIGVKWDFIVAGKMHQFEILDFTGSAILVERCNDVFIDSFIINAGDAESRGTNGAIRLQDKTEAIVVTNGDVLLGEFSLVSDATTNAVGSRPAYNYFSNVYFDSQQQFSYLDKTVETSFVNCWWSGSRVSSPSAALRLLNTASIKFTNCIWFNCGGIGCLVESTARNSHFIGCSFQSNGQNQTSLSGLRIADNSSEFTITNCVANNDLYGGQQSYGLLIGDGSSKFSVTNNSVEGNGISGILLGSSLSQFTVSGNIGFKSFSKGTASIPNGATFVDVTHSLGKTPGTGDILAARRSPPAGTASFWIDTIGATTFRINVNVTPSSTIHFAWHADAQTDN